VDGAIVNSIAAGNDRIVETAEILPRVTKDISKPVLGCFMGIVDVSEGVKILEKNGIPDYTSRDAVRALASMARFGYLLGLKGGK